MPNFKVLAVVAVAFLALDFVWLGVLMKSFYDLELGTLARRHGDSLAPRWGAAILVYLLIPAGIVLFVGPHLRGGTTAWHALAWGAAYGLVVYGVYDLTNLAVLEKWTWRMTLIDLAWGATICAVSAVVMQYAATYFER